MLNREYRTKELIRDIIEVMTILNDKGMLRVRPVFHTSSTVQYKPMFMVGFDTPQHKAKYVMFTSKYYDDDAGKKTGRYSSIRLVGFSGDTSFTEKVSVEDIKAMSLQELEDRPYRPRGHGKPPSAVPKPPMPSYTKVTDEEDDEDDSIDSDTVTAVRKLGKSIGVSDEHVEELLKNSKPMKEEK